MVEKRKDEKRLRCPICEKVGLNEQISKDRVDYKGETTELIYTSLCAILAVLSRLMSSSHA